MNQAFSLLSIWVATALVALACSTENGASTDGLDNPCGDACDGQSPLDLLPPDTLISTLNKDELVAFCERRDTFHTTFLTLQTNPSLECTAEGLDLRFQEGADVQACEAARDMHRDRDGDPTTELRYARLPPLSSQQYREMRTCAVSLEAFDNCTAALLVQAEALVESSTAPSRSKKPPYSKPKTTARSPLHATSSRAIAPRSSLSSTRTLIEHDD